jgi:hypothetical protein
MPYASKWEQQEERERETHTHTHTNSELKAFQFELGHVSSRRAADL